VDIFDAKSSFDNIKNIYNMINREKFDFEKFKKEIKKDYEFPQDIKIASEIKKITSDDDLFLSADFNNIYIFNIGTIGELSNNTIKNAIAKSITFDTYELETIRPNYHISNSPMAKNKKLANEFSATFYDDGLRTISKFFDQWVEYPVPGPNLIRFLNEYSSTVTISKYHHKPGSYTTYEFTECFPTGLSAKSFEYSVNPGITTLDVKFIYKDLKINDHFGDLEKP
jgi:hypothetical protein